VSEFPTIDTTAKYYQGSPVSVFAVNDESFAKQSQYIKDNPNITFLLDSGTAYSRAYELGAAGYPVYCIVNQSGTVVHVGGLFHHDEVTRIVDSLLTSPVRKTAPVHGATAGFAVRYSGKNIVAQIAPGSGMREAVVSLYSVSGKLIGRRTVSGGSAHTVMFSGAAGGLGIVSLTSGGMTISRPVILTDR